MRRVIPVVLLLTACSTAAGDTTTATAPLAEPSTTSTAPSTTTTTEPTTTTTEESCGDRDGVMRDPRGTICPPHLDSFHMTDESFNYLPGRYVTRSFSPGFSFERIGRFQSPGENSALVVLDDAYTCERATCMRRVIVFSSEVASELRSFDFRPLDRTSQVTRSEEDFQGQAAETIDVVFDEQGCNNSARIALPLNTIPGAFGLAFCSQVRMLFAEVGGETVSVMIERYAAEFDTYWAEVAKPILDSIEFLDP